MTAAGWDRAREVLCVRLDSLGDVLMTTPALRALKGLSGKPRLTLLTSPSGAAVAPLVPEVDDVVVYDAPWLKATAPRAGSAPDAAMIELLARRGFDASVIFTVYSQSPLPSALLCHLAGIPLRLAHCRENPYGLLSDWVPEPEPERLVRHEVQRQLDLVGAIGASTGDDRLSLVFPDEVRSSVAERLTASGLRLDSSWAVVHPGGTAPSRRYHPERFALVADALQRDHGWHIVFSGTESERALVAEVQAAMSSRARSLVGELSVAEMAALVELAPVLISNNTAPVHMAAAVGTPVVDLYALTNPQHTPWKVPHAVLYHDVPCRFCLKSVCPQGHHDCLARVSPEAVVAAALRLAAGHADVSIQPLLAIGPLFP